MTAVPRFAFATHELAIVARDLRDQRAAGDPKAVTEGKLTQAQADDRLRIADALAGEWAAYDRLGLPEGDRASDAEKLAMLDRSLAVIAARRDKAHASMLAEKHEHLGRMDVGALWQLVDSHDPWTGRIEAYLHWESYAAAIEALLWWQRRTGVESKRFAIETTITARAWREQVRAAA